MIKICIDAGHYGKYNHSPVVPAYYESDMTWKLSNLQKKFLEEYSNVEVILTRTNKDKDLDLYSRGAASKGCDLFISNHSTACGTESVDRVEVYHLVNDTTTGIDEKSKAIGGALALAITDAMGVSQPCRVLSRQYGGDRNKDGLMNDNYYGVLHGARMVGTPGLLIEHSYHTNTKMAKWMLDDNNLAKLAKAEVETLAKYFGLVKKESVNDAPSISFNNDDSAYPRVPFEVKVLVDDLNYRAYPSMQGAIRGQTKKGVFTIIQLSGDWGRLRSGAGWIYLANPEYCEIVRSNEVPFVVRVMINNLEIYKGPGTDYLRNPGYTGIGTFTIVEVREGKGSDTGWGRLKSGAGWIALDHTMKI